MKVSITVVATKTFTAGRLELSRDVDIKKPGPTGGRMKPYEDSIGRAGPTAGANRSRTSGGR
jgi:hypothetical protein